MSRIFRISVAQLFYVEWSSDTLNTPISLLSRDTLANLDLDTASLLL